MIRSQGPGRAVYFYTDKFQGFDYGPLHPLRVDRLALVHELMGLCFPDQPPALARPASREELGMYHDRRYLDTLEQLSACRNAAGYHAFGLGAGDNPIFPRLYQWSALLAGATLQAAEEVMTGRRQVAFNIAGGMHHALAARAAGFCYVNDPVLALKKMVNQGFRAAYVDLDAHHGDGVQWAFYDDPRVLTISLHQHPDTLFPGTGYSREMGKGPGRGYSVNLPLRPDTDDDIYVRCFEEIVPPLLDAFQPDFVVTQLGVDAFLDDPLANLNLTTNGFGRCLRGLRDMCLGRWVALGGGGYDVINVARGWTLAWAVMLGREDELPAILPEEFRRRHGIPGRRRRLLDPPDKLRGRFYARAVRDAEEAVDHIKRNIFPILMG